MSLRLRTANNCGIGADVIIPLQVSGGGGFFRMISPNPTTNTVAVNFFNDSPFNTIKKAILVSSIHPNQNSRSFVNSNPNSSIRAQNKNISFDVSDLPRGLYYLVMTFEGNKVFKETIQLL